MDGSNKNMLKWILAFFLIIINQSIWAFTFEPSESKLAKVDHAYFSLGYIEKFEQPAWTYYHYKKQYLRGTHHRTGDFKEDPILLTDSAKPEEYKYSGYDRGHMVPSGDMKITQESQEQSFYMSNISPQKPRFNRGIWRKLENQVREWVRKKGDVHVYTGPIFSSKKVRFINKTKIAIPDAFYKIILKKEDKLTKVIAFLMPNKKSDEEIEKYLVSVDEIEKKTKIDFLSDLPDTLENKIEKEINKDFWY